MFSLVVDMLIGIVTLLLFIGQAIRSYILSRPQPDLTDPKIKIIHNDRVKLQAAFLNTVAAGLVVTGVIGPMATYLYGTTAETKHTGWQIFGEIVSLLLAGGSVHGVANWSLRRLEV